MESGNPSKRLLVTGGCGFIGSSCVNHFVLEKGWRVVNVDRLTYAGNPDHIDERVRTSPLYTLEVRNVDDSEGMEELMHQNDIDTVVHFAAQSHVDASFRDPHQFVKDNINATVSLLQAAADYGKLERFVHVSTDEVYGDQDDGVGVDETSPMRPSNPYAASKASAEMFVHAFSRSYRLPTIITRANNVIGENQFPEKVLPRFIELLRRQEPFTLQGAGEQTRSFLDSRDAATAFSHIVERGRIWETYNIESANVRSVRQLADTLVRVSQRPHPGFVHIGDRPYNDTCYLLDGRKLRDHTGWTQTVPFDDTLRRVWDASTDEPPSDSPAN